MKKNKPGHICSECGYASPKWLGKCPQCDKWNTFLEMTAEPVSSRKKNISQPSQAVSLAKISSSEGRRLSTGLKELDRVLGGGLVQGSTVLLGGEPGIGKSTILLQVALFLAQQGFRILYASGEENSAQIRLRSDRIGLVSENLFFLANGQVEEIQESFSKIKPNLLIVDSIQTSQTLEHPSGPGSVAQIRESAYYLSQLVSSFSISENNSSQDYEKASLILTGHITKDGSIAGPKLLEHLVDCVLYFEGDRLRDLRMIRAFKNRFGAINEMGLFQMTKQGLAEVSNPTSFFLDQNIHGPTPGSVLVPVREGSLILLIEVQSLVNEITYQMPRRAAEGVDSNHVQLMSAVLEKNSGLALRNSDIYIRIPGGVNIDDPAVDLGILASIASSLKQESISADTCVMGEVTLSGNLRPVSMLNERLKAMENQKINNAVIPESQYRQDLPFPGKILPARNVNDVLRLIFS